MRIVKQKKGTQLNFEDLLETLQAKKGITEPKEENKQHFKAFPWGTVALFIMVVALGTMVIILKSDIAVLKNDIAHLRDFRAQIATLDPKMQISNAESKFADLEKEEGPLKREMNQLKIDLETIKTEPAKVTNKVSKKLTKRPPPKQNRSSKVKNEDILKKKISPQDIYFSDISRATNPDPSIK